MGDPGGAPPSAPPTTVEIDAQDVVRVVLQWARESGLDATAAALGREARVALNAPPGGRAALLADVRRGRWDAVLPTVATLELPRSVLESLYELVRASAAPPLLCRCRCLRKARLRGGRRRALRRPARRRSGWALKRRLSRALRTSGALCGRRGARGAAAENVRAGLHFTHADARPRKAPGGAYFRCSESLPFASSHTHTHSRARPPERWQVALEMAESRERDTARALLRQTEVMAAMAQSQPERHERLERTVGAAYFDAREAYGAGGREARRETLAEALKRECVDAPPGRLLALLGHALKWQQSVGALPAGAARFDLFAGAAAAATDTQERAKREAPCVRPARRTRVAAKGQHAECLALSPDGALLAVGSSDGFIELRDVGTGKLRADLQFQAEDAFMMHEDAVLALAFSRDSELLATGSADGAVRVWKALTGAQLRRYDAAHAGGVNSVVFSRDNSHVLTAGGDGVVRVHGLRSGRLLKELRGHDGAASSAVYSEDHTRIYSAGRDGMVRVWDAKTGDNLLSFGPPKGTDGASAATTPDLTLALHRGPAGSADGLLVAMRGTAELHLMSIDGELVRTLRRETRDIGKSDKEKDATGRTVANLFSACCSSAAGEFIYGATQSGALVCFARDGREEGVAEGVHEGGDVLALATHPHANRIYSCGTDAKLTITEP